MFGHILSTSQEQVDGGFIIDRERAIAMERYLLLCFWFAENRMFRYGQWHASIARNCGTDDGGVSIACAACIKASRK